MCDEIKKDARVMNEKAYQGNRISEDSEENYLKGQSIGTLNSLREMHLRKLMKIQIAMDALQKI
jgi:hypothetical protein